MHLGVLSLEEMMSDNITIEKIFGAFNITELQAEQERDAYFANTSAYLNHFRRNSNLRIILRFQKDSQNCQVTQHFSCGKWQAIASGSPVGRNTILEGTSFVDQGPTGLGLAGSHVVTFGAQQVSTDGTVRLNADGTLEMLAPIDPLNLRFSMRLGRTGTGGTSDFVVWGEISTDGIVYTPTQDVTIYKIATSQQIITYNLDGDFANLPAGTFVRIKVARDEAGVDDGGLFTQAPTGTLVGIGASFSAQVQLKKRTII